MPFESQAQWDWAFATGQPWARDWAKHTPGGKRKYALLKRRASAKRYKHLPGQHNQQSHGRSGRGGGGMSASAFNAWNDREIAKIEDMILNIGNRKPYALSANERDRIHQIIAKTHPKARFDVVDSFITYNASRGLTPDEIILSGVNVPAISGGIGLRNISEQPFINALIRQHYNEQRIRISNMDADAQQQILDGIKSKTDRTSWDYDTAAGLSIYANPQTRWESIELLMNDDNSKNPRTLSNGTKLIDTTQNHELNTARDVMQYYSLDYRLYSAMYAANGYSTPEYGVTPKGQEDRAFNDFMAEFTNTHTSQNTNNVLGAQIQQAVSMIGPNAGGKYPSFYPRGVKPPEPNPEVIRLLNEQYQATQQRYANWGVTEIPLYRGQNPDFAMGIPMGPWSDDQSVAVRFAIQHQNGIFNTASMPVEYILMDYNDVNFRTQYKESEYLVTENAFVRNSRRKKIGQKPITNANGSQVYLQDVAWTEKAFQELPPTSSYLEQDYDIFYNYRTDDKQSARRKRREKAYRYKAEVEARGNAPGRRWSAGSGEVITGNLGRDASGRFVNVGSGSRAVSSAVETIARAQRQNTKKPKKPKKQTLTAEQRAQQRQQERARAGESGMQELGYSKEQYAALATIRGNPQPVGESIDESTQSLIDAGFVEIINGNAVSTSLGKKVLSSVQSGSPGDAQEAIIRDQEKRQEREQKRVDRIDALDEKIALLQDKIDNPKTGARSRAVAQRKLARYQTQLNDLTGTKQKHLPGQHDQRAHGRSTARRQAYRSAYSAARAGGASIQDARAAARDASQQELQKKLDARRAERADKLRKRDANRKPKPDTTTNPSVVNLQQQYGKTPDTTPDTKPTGKTRTQKQKDVVQQLIDIETEITNAQKALNRAINDASAGRSSLYADPGESVGSAQDRIRVLAAQKTDLQMLDSYLRSQAFAPGGVDAHPPYTESKLAGNTRVKDPMNDESAKYIAQRITGNDSIISGNRLIPPDPTTLRVVDVPSEHGIKVSVDTTTGSVYFSKERDRGQGNYEFVPVDDTVGVGTRISQPLAQLYTERASDALGMQVRIGSYRKIEDMSASEIETAKRNIAAYQSARKRLIEQGIIYYPNAKRGSNRRKSSSGYTPPADVQAAAKRGLELRRKFGRGGTEVGVARARDLSNGKSISAQTIRRMVSYFARHAVDKRPDWSNPSDPTPGYIAWMLWGGDAGKRWANAMNKRIKE